MGRKLILIILGGIALCCVWFVIMAIQVGDARKACFFGFVGLMFAAVPIFEIVKAISKKNVPGLDARLRGESQPTRFIPHWQIMAMLGAALVLIILAIIIPLLR
jgi:hypothetical protein